MLAAIREVRARDDTLTAPSALDLLAFPGVCASDARDEGATQQAAMQLLTDLGCDQAQGFYMGKPMPGDDMKRWMGESPWGLGDEDGDLACAVPG